MTQPASKDTEKIAAELREVLATGNGARLVDFVARFHPSDLADLIEWLEDEERVAVLTALPAAAASDALVEMEEEEHPEDLLVALAPQKRAELLQELPADDAVDLIADLEPEERAQLLAELPVEEAGELRDLLFFGEDTAGGLMTPELVAVRHDLTAAEAIAEVRRQGREVENFYNIFVVDEGRKLLGTVPLHDLILADPDSPVSALVEPPLVTVLAGTDQEEVGRLMAHYNLVSMPVVAEDGTLLGRITFDDVIDVLEEEQTEDIFHFAGLSVEEGLRGRWLDAVRSRLPWLGLNLLTAILAASVVYLFSEAIANAVVLAAIMPIIAGMGGNAGTQALAVTVRRIALSEETIRQRWRVVAKEVLVGLTNGAALGLVTAALSLLVGGQATLGLVVLLAMWGNIVVAGFAGSFVPILLERLGIDPAVASSIFVTTFTDLCGFFLLLGLASAILI